MCPHCILGAIGNWSASLGAECLNIICRGLASGLCHDMGHPGRNNALFSNALEPLALLYNDRAVLENYHACLTFKTLEKPDCDIFMALKTRVSCRNCSYRLRHLPHSMDQVSFSVWVVRRRSLFRNI